MSGQYLLTGATGFIGANLVRRLVEKREHVSIITRSEKLNWRLQEITAELDIHVCDLLNLPLLEKNIAKIRPTVIFHLAAYGAMPSESQTEKMIDINLKGTLNLINASRKYGFKLFVNTGSSSEYGVKTKAMKESDLLEPVNDYGVTKAATTLFCQKMSRLEKLSIVTLRLFSPYGYYEDPQRFIPYVVSHSLINKPLELSHPNYVRDFVFIEDVVDAYLKAVDTSFSFGAIVNIGSAKQTALRDVVELVVNLTRSNSEIRWHAKPGQNRQVEPKNWRADITEAQKLLDWKPRHTFEYGLKKTILWTKKNLYYYL